MSENIFYYVFDMDGTIVFTDELNNESYNYALLACNLNPIINEKRITRETVKKYYPYIEKPKMDIVIDKKQRYFVENIWKVRANTCLLDIIRRLGNNCILWTSSDRKRAMHICNFLKIKGMFNFIIFSDKKNICRDISKICNRFACAYDQLIVFENDANVVHELKIQGIKCFLLISK